MNRKLALFLVLGCCAACSQSSPSWTDAGTGRDASLDGAGGEGRDGGVRDGQVADGQVSDGSVPLPTIRSSPVGYLNIPNQIQPYSYGPSIVFEDGTYYAFYCSPSDSPPYPFDAIRLTTSTNGVTWTSPVVALAAQGNYASSSVCDPSVVKFRGVYFLYHTCINTGAHGSPSPPDGYQNNRICVAIADHIAGPYRFYDDAVIEDLTCSPTEGSYCVGQPAALVQDDQVYVYYTNHRPGDPSPGPGNIFLRKSKDGISFGPVENQGQPVWNHRNVDVKFDRASKRYFLVQGEVDTVPIFWAVSSDGVHFTPWDSSRILATNPALPEPAGRNHNPGIASLSDGSFSGMSFVVYASTFQPDNPLWSHLYRSDIIIDPDSTDCSGCVADSCDRGCTVTAGAPRVGECVNPGSTSPGQCCACAPEPAIADCSECADGCVAACVGATFSVGVCAAPGSQNPSSCCGCY